MQLIHENDFCRDIAIWYDEFLTPGEDFNDSIRSALQKSTLFALAVTPNLVNEKNYVMDVEYPMAQKQNKKILPVELQDTNRLLLKWYFKSLPKCVAKNDKQGLSSSLAAVFRDIAMRETDSSPEHLLFIGLAYLNGIDVEVDSARGVKLITRSAEGGLPQAMEKLVQLYRRGTASRWIRNKPSYGNKGLWKSGGSILTKPANMEKNCCRRCSSWPNCIWR